MYKKLQAILLPTKEKSPIQLGVNFHHNIPGQLRGTFFHLYIISDDEITINDNVLSTINGRQYTFKCNSAISEWNCQTHTEFFKKIIASTDSSLGVAAISTEDLAIYCKTQPEEVLVKYDAIPNEWDNPFTNPEGIETKDSEWELNVEDNFIPIKWEKRTYAREDLIAFGHKVQAAGSFADVEDLI